MSTGGGTKRRHHRSRRSGNNNNRTKAELTAASSAAKDEMSSSILSDGASVSESQISASLAADESHPMLKSAVDMDTSDIVSNISESPVFANIGEPKEAAVEQKNKKDVAIVDAAIPVSSAQAKKVAPVMKMVVDNTSPFVGNNSRSSSSSSRTSTAAAAVVSPPSTKTVPPAASASASSLSSGYPPQSVGKERRVKILAKRIYKIFEVPLNYVCENVTQRVILPNLRLVDMLIQDLPAKFRVTAVWWIELFFVACGFLFLAFWFFVTKVGLWFFQTGVMLALMPIRITKTGISIVYRVVKGLLIGTGGVVQKAE